ncbi:MAG: FecCD family ABC transporter permease [Bacillota bacterium]
MSLTGKKFLVLSFVFLVLVALYLSLGSVNLVPTRVFMTLFGQGSRVENFVILGLRLPRLLIVIFSGAALALSGTILQGITQNDLADPGIIGINAGAGVGVTVFFLLFTHTVKDFAYFLPLAAFIGGALSAGLILLFSYSKQGGLNPLKMLLVGIGFSMALSGFMVLLVASSDREEVAFITRWLSGNVWGGDWPFVVVVVPLIILAAIGLYFQSQILNILNLGSDVATGLGVPLKKSHYMLLGYATLLAGLAVSVSGNIAFLGLVAPHIAKRVVGRRHQVNLIFTALLGGTLLVAADLLGKNFVEPNGIPTGIIVSLIGAPYFITLLIKKTQHV